MKFFAGILLLVALIELAVADRVISKHELAKIKKYSLHREPPLDKHAKFAEDEWVWQRWIQQRLNHFDPQDTRVWDMQYLENTAFQQPGGPIFIYVGGEWSVSSGWLLTGHMHDMARDLNGTMYYTEHRYYGQSRPTPDLTMDSLRYLNVDQALADLAHFIVTMKQNNPNLRDSGVILVGASYSATMVTWFLQKYPHLANGGWSSSAPLKAKVDFIEYKEVVSEAFEIVGGQSCTGRIRRAFAELDRLAAEGNTARIEEMFHLCYPLNLTNSLDTWSFFSSIASPFSGIVQYHREHDQDIQNECNQLMNTGVEDDLESLAMWWWGDTVDPEDPLPFCYDHRYFNYIYFFSGTSWDDLGAYFEIRQWLYQTCAEYGWFQSSGSDNILFGSNFPVGLSLALCRDLYSGAFTPESVQSNVDRVNTLYGALNPSVRNVYSTHGQLDPWRSMGVQEDINEFSPTVILPLESHCSDLYSVSERDTPEMAASKQRISELVRLWLQ